MQCPLSHVHSYLGGTIGAILIYRIALKVPPYTVLGVQSDLSYMRLSYTQTSIIRGILTQSLSSLLQYNSVKVSPLIRGPLLYAIFGLHFFHSENRVLERFGCIVLIIYHFNLLF